MHHPTLPLVPSGAAYFPAQARALPQKVTFLLLPGFTLLAFGAALDPFRIANQLSQKPLYHWTVVSDDGQPVASSSGVAVGVDGALEDSDRETILLVCSGNLSGQPVSARARAALARHYRFGGQVGGICTGAEALAQAGLLADHRFTLHWENQPAFVERFPDLTPSPRKVEIDGRILTCGGGLAATDLAILLIEQSQGGDFAQAVSDMCLHRAGPATELPQRASVAAHVGKRNPVVVRGLALMASHIEEPLSMDDLAGRLCTSRRHLERMFLDCLGTTPARHYMRLRLERARSLLLETDMTMTEVAIACGFGSKAYFSKAFAARYGCPPVAVLRSR